MGEGRISWFLSCFQSLQEYKPARDFLEEATYLFHLQRKECVVVVFVVIVVVLMVILLLVILALGPQANAEQPKKEKHRDTFLQSAC